jgi:hypothetical protein
MNFNSDAALSTTQEAGFEATLTVTKPRAGRSCQIRNQPWHARLGHELQFKCGAIGSSKGWI